MAVLEGEVKDLKRTIGGHGFDGEVSQSESLKAREEKERQHRHHQPLFRQSRVRTLARVPFSQSPGGGIYLSALRRPRDSKIVTRRSPR